MGRRLVAAAAFAAFLFCAADAGATVAVPAKAVWSVTDVGSMQYCEHCNIDAIDAARRKENYRKVIADTVALGAKQILVHAVTGAASSTRVGEFFSELKSYSDANGGGVCGALMYADYGSAHPNDQIDAQWSTAWANSGDGAVYCTLGGKPVVATLEDRPDFDCQINKYINIFTVRINKLSGGSNGFNWVAAFGETSEFASWQSKCQGKIAGVISSYLEMANDNPLAGADASTRKSIVAGAGGTYILGIPTASAQNCGGFCGDGTDATANVNNDFSGFLRTLAAWRAGVDQLAYTYGPGGRVKRDEFVSSAVTCGPNDMVTPASTCAALGPSTLARAPGFP